MKRKVVIVELGTSHEELFYSQISFLSKNGWSVNLICSSVLKSRTQNLSVDKIFFDFGKNFFQDFFNLIRIRRYLTRNNFNKVILNSAHGILIRTLLLFPFPKEIEFIGIVHDVEKIFKSKNQKIINKKVKKYFVLSDYVLDYVRYKNPDDLIFESFYPVFQPESFTTEITKPENEFWICIPGRVEQKRRDYITLLNQLSITELNKKVKIIFLGKIDKTIKSEFNNILKKPDLNQQLIVFNEFISSEIFYTYLKQSDVVLPLIHPGDKWFNKYFKTQISGSFNMAYTYKIPMLCEKSFSIIEDFSDTSFFYEIKNLIVEINHLAGDIEYFTNKKSNMYKLGKWDFEFQKNKYNNFLGETNFKK